MVNWCINIETLRVSLENKKDLITIDMDVFFILPESAICQKTFLSIIPRVYHNDW